LDASSSQFWIRVRSLGEFVFCPRAGVLAAKKGGDEEEVEYDQVHLDFLPQYSLAVIEEQLAIRLPKMGAWIGRILGALFGMGLAWWFDWKWLMLGISLVIFFMGRRLSQGIRAVLTLSDYRRQALDAEPKEPNFTGTTRVDVNWWELLKAGFDSIRPQETFRDEGMKLAGKPWRVLRKGDLRIPVIKLSADRFEGGRYWVFPQHEIRLAAYALLIEACEGCQSPYGVILFSDTFQGVAITISPEFRKQVIDRLEQFRSVLLAFENGPPPDPPAKMEICSGCLFGLPKPVDGSVPQNSKQKIHGVTGRDGTLCHSECGDQFGWVPPHSLAKRKGLLPPGA